MLESRRVKVLDRLWWSHFASILIAFAAFFYGLATGAPNGYYRALTWFLLTATGAYFIILKVIVRLSPKPSENRVNQQASQVLEHGVTCQGEADVAKREALRLGAIGEPDSHKII